MARIRVALAILAVAALAVPAPGHGLPGRLDDVGTRHDVVPQTNGTFMLGLLGIGIHDADGNGTDALNLDPVSWQRWTTEPPQCDRRLFIDLDYAPQNLTGSHDAPLSVAYTFRVSATQGNHGGETVVATPSENLYLTTVPDDTPIVIDLVLLTGAQVDWSFRVEGRQDFTAEGCQPDPI